MSRSQFYSIKSFILTHAWLNLWDERMTTGRINQVAIAVSHSFAVKQNCVLLRVRHQTDISVAVARVFVLFKKKKSVFLLSKTRTF